MKHISIAFLLFVNLMLSVWFSENFPSFITYTYLIISTVSITLYLLHLTKKPKEVVCEWEPRKEILNKPQQISHQSHETEKERIRKLEIAFTNKITPYVSEEIERAKIFGLDKVEVKVKPYLFPYPNITHNEMKVVEKLMENEIRQKFNLPYVNVNLDNYLLTISGITQTLE